MSAKCRMAYLVALLLAGVAGPSSPADEAPARPPELKALGRFIGTWDTKATVKVAEWSPKEVRTTGSVKCEWVLGRRLIQGKGNESPKQQFLMQWTYDVNRKAYRTWFFNSAGTVAEWSGTWKPGPRTFVLTNDLGNGITDTLTARFVDDSTVEWTSEAKGRDGKLYFAMDARWSRRK